jgi:hypothetical protein
VIADRKENALAVGFEEAARILGRQLFCVRFKLIHELACTEKQKNPRGVSSRLSRVFLQLILLLN